MDIENIKERDRSGQIHIDDRTVILRRGLMAKKMTRDLKGRIRQTGRMVMDQPDAEKPESFATEWGQRVMAKEAKERAGNVKDIGNKSVRETAKTVREQVRIRKEIVENASHICKQNKVGLSIIDSEDKIIDATIDLLERYRHGYYGYVTATF